MKVNKTRWLGYVNTTIAQICNHKCSKTHSGFKIVFTLFGSPPHFSTMSLIIKTSNSCANFNFAILYPFSSLSFYIPLIK
jgi:hypothetical protein